MLLNYDTIIFDLDFTLWKGCRPQFWARLLNPPYILKGARFYGISNEYIELQSGVPEVLKFLYYRGKNIGFASRGAAKDIEFDNQPSVLALKTFEIYKYFNYQKVLVWKDIDKIPLLKPLGKTAYVDDSENELQKANIKYGNLIECININLFKDWWNIL